MCWGVQSPIFGWCPYLKALPPLKASQAHRRLGRRKSRLQSRVQLHWCYYQIHKEAHWCNGVGLCFVVFQAGGQMSSALLLSPPSLGFVLISANSFASIIAPSSRVENCSI